MGQVAEKCTSKAAAVPSRRRLVRLISKFELNQVLKTNENEKVKNLVKLLQFSQKSETKKQNLLKTYATSKSFLQKNQPIFEQIKSL